MKEEKAVDKGVLGCAIAPPKFGKTKKKKKKKKDETKCKLIPLASQCKSLQAIRTISVNSLGHLWWFIGIHSIDLDQNLTILSPVQTRVEIDLDQILITWILLRSI